MFRQQLRKRPRDGDDLEDEARPDKKSRAESRPDLQVHAVTPDVSHEASPQRSSTLNKEPSDVSMADDSMDPSSSQPQTLPLHTRVPSAGLNLAVSRDEKPETRMPTPFYNTLPLRQPPFTQPPPSPVSDNDAEPQVGSTKGQSPGSDINAADNMDVDVNTASQGVGSLSLAASSNGPSRGGKKFFMGYVADCPKCIAKVPGHFNHFR